MLTIYDQAVQRKPVKIWLESFNQLDSECLKQALNLANLPFVHQWVALMPDVHTGYGMPIGGVLATEGVVIPNAVGVDIGCGMAYCETGIYKSQLNKEVVNNIVGKIMRDIPTGFAHHKKKQSSKVLDQFLKGYDLNIEPSELVREIERGYNQIGTLGSGNHFIELQEDEDGMICIMVHSGSRNFGLKIANYFNKLAEKLNEESVPIVPREHQLAYLFVDTPEGDSYLKWMNLALDFALENREQMIAIIKDILKSAFPGASFTNQINAHHNYCALERHYGKDVWVHRKGAIKAEDGELGIIPGAMGSFSYIVQGKGNPESFKSCSHGAGRTMSRKQAKKEFSVDKTINDLKNLGVVLGKKHKVDVSEECRFAYKNIDEVIKNELDLITPLKKLKTLAVIKG